MPNMNQVMTDVAAPPPEGAPAMEETSSSQSSSLPEDVLKIPAINAVLEGSPPAVFAAAGSKSPELKTLEKNIDALKDSGFGFYRTKDSKNFVMFNSLYLTPDEVKQADESGQLESVASSFDEVNGAMSEGFAGGESATAATAPAAGNPPPASAQRNLMTKRVNNTQPGGPTSGARPGQGRVLNNIQKSVI
jgi:hypothetical protein